MNLKIILAISIIGVFCIAALFVSNSLNEINSGIQNLRYNETIIQQAQEIRNEPDCIKAGGKWGYVQSFFQSCTLTYSDANKLCTSDSECIGGCIATNYDMLDSGIGICKPDTNHTGCFAAIENDTIRCINDDIVVLCHRDSKEPECRDL